MLYITLYIIKHEMYHIDYFMKVFSYHVVILYIEWQAHVLLLFAVLHICTLFAYTWLYLYM